MYYFDFHTHAFADAIAERAMDALIKNNAPTPCTDGTLNGAIMQAKASGVSKFMLLPVATKPSQQKTINNWAKKVMEENENVFCFGTVYPDAEDVMQEIERVKELGLYGIKLHSEYQGFFPDAEKMIPIYRKIASCGLPVVFHGGWDPLSPDFTKATPQRFAKAAAAVPEMTFIVAHLGGMKLWDDVEKYLAGKFSNVYFDVSVVADVVSDEQLLRIIRTHGADKILFGSDMPWDNPANEIRMIERLPISQEEKELIAYRNAEHLMELVRTNR